MAKKRARVREPQHQQPPQESSKGAGRGSKMHRVDAAGAEICFKYAKGAASACPDPWPQGRKHIYQLCRGTHRNADCPQAAGGGSPL